MLIHTYMQLELIFHAVLQCTYTNDVNLLWKR